MDILSLIRSIKQKKELQTISDIFVQEKVLLYLKRNQLSLADLSNPRAASYKKIVKEVRAQLRKVYGLFRTEQEEKERRKLLQQLYSSSFLQQKNILKKILETHSSTKERAPIYPLLYKKIFTLTGAPKSILDLGCGINPFSLIFMQEYPLRYHAYDLNEEELHDLSTFFTFLHQQYSSFSGTAQVGNLLNFSFRSSLPHADLCFLFKITDILDQGKGHSKTEEVIKSISARHLIISFSTKTMSGKSMNAPRRHWMEWLCKRLRYKYQILEFENEIFYVVEK